MSTYERHMQRWRNFCSAHGFDPLCDNPFLLAVHLTQLRVNAELKGVGPQTVAQASTAIGCMYRQAGKTPPTAAPIVGVVLDVARRTLTATPLHREEITGAEVRRLVQVHIVDGCDLQTRMLVTSMVLCYAGQLRYDDLSHVMVHYDLMRLFPDRADVYLWRSKTDPHAKGAWVTIARLGGDCCPVGLLEALLAAGRYVTRPTVTASGDELEDVGPLLRQLSRKGGEWQLQHTTAPWRSCIPALPYKEFAARMKLLLKAAGITKAIGTHSFRIGATTAAVEGGADPDLVQKAGRWRSQQVFQNTYVRDGVARKLAVSQSMNLQE